MSRQQQFRATAPEDRFAVLCLLLFVTAVGAYAAFSRHLLNDGDTGWHLAAGRYILQSKSVPVSDPFSFTFAGQPWHAHEWLSEVIMGLAFEAAGWRGIFLLFSIAGAATLFLLGRELLRRVPVRWALCLTFVLCMLLQAAALARPHVLAWPILAAWILILLRARDSQRAPPLAALLLIVLWSNMHASYVLGLGTAAIFAAEAVLEDRHALRTWTVFIIGTVLAAILTPHGLSGLTYPFEVSGMQVASVIQEWRQTNLQDDKLFIAFSVALWALVLLQWRKLHPLRIIMLAVLTVMAIIHARHQMPMVIIANLLAAPLLGEKLPKPSLRYAEWGITAIAILIVGRLAIPFQMQDNASYPVTALSRVPAHLRSQPVFNDYSFGGPLVLHGIRPYIDGRADVYGDDFTLDYTTMVRGNARRFRVADERWQFEWTILPPNAGLVPHLDRDQKWERFYADRWAVIHIRSP